MIKKAFITKMLDLGVLPNVDNIIELADIYDNLSKCTNTRSVTHKWTEDDEKELYRLHRTMTVQAIADKMNLPYRIVTNKIYKDKKEQS